MKLVIVDDSLLNLKFAEGTLKKNQVAIDIALCNSGEEAMDYIHHHHTDIMLLDIIMPGLSGIDVLKLIKTDEKLKAIEVIMFSSLGDKTTLHECFELGAVDYISKPLDELEFLARIKSAIRKKTLEKSSLAYLREIEKQNESLSQLNVQLKTAQNQIVQQEKMASVGHLAAGIAHEINNPLGFISSNFSTLRKYIEKYKSHLEEVKDYLKAELHEKGEADTFFKLASNKEIDFINSDFQDLFNDTQEGLERVGAIVRGLRNFSRIDSLDEMSLYNLNEGIENTLVISRNEVKYVANVEIEYGEVKDIYAYGGQINQVLLNLLLNACSAIKSKHGSEKGTITIRTWSNHENVFVSVRDNGSGINPVHIRDVFNPFFTTKPVGEGTGLGLSISYDIICAKHKGWIDVKSEFGQWTEFTISLPFGNLIE